MALATKRICGAKAPQNARYSQQNILGTFFDTLVEITGILLILVELCSDKAQPPLMPSRR